MYGVLIGGGIMILFGIAFILYDKWTSRKEQRRAK
jgi:hypothetical protein